MVKKNTKSATDEAPRKRGRPARAEEEEEEVEAEAAPLDDDDSSDGELPVVADARDSLEPDPREVDNMTDRIFRSVLARYGWERHGSRIEHVGDTQQRRSR